MTRVQLVIWEGLGPEHQDLVVSSLQPGKEVDVYRAIANDPPVLTGFRSFLGAVRTSSGVTASGGWSSSPWPERSARATSGTST